MKLLFALSVLMLPLLSYDSRAQSTQADPTRFQSTSYFRLAPKFGVARDLGNFAVIPAQTFTFAILDAQTFRPVVDPFTGKPRAEAGVAYLYESRTPFQKIVAGGSNYAVLADGSLIAFSSTWDKPIPKGQLQFEVETYGGTFMIKKGTREIVTVNSTGFVNFSTGVIAPAIRRVGGNDFVGGNYFIDANNDLWVIDYRGDVHRHDSSQVYTYKDNNGNEVRWSYSNYPQAHLPGGNFFYQQDGSVVTIASDGTVLDPFFPTARPKVLGGNYYLGEDDAIYSIRYDGMLFKNGPSVGRHKYLGYSYLVYENGAFVTIDGMGLVHNDAVRVSPTKTQYIKVTAVKEPLDPKSVYTPNSRK